MMRGSTEYHTTNDGVYIISVAARILEMHPQTLRKYERIGLVSPFRTGGMLRLYSEEDIARLRLIKHLVGDLGLNLAGVELVLAVFNRLLRLRAGSESLQGERLKRVVDQSLAELFEMLGVGAR
jgi:MerR family transcriptional regulator/heat shock protein HspR